jgi:hypothetical protein
MILTRTIDISDRVFTIPDLLRIAKILDREVEGSEGQRARPTYEVSFEESLVVEGSATEVLNEEVLTRPSRPRRVEMRLIALRPDRSIRVDLVAGDSKFDNRARVSGEGDSWVNATCSVIREAIDKTAPQSFWWRKHRTLLLNLIALGTGDILSLFSRFMAAHTSSSFFDSHITMTPTLRAYGRFVASVGITWIGLFWGWLGTLPMALAIRSWILSMWPSVEFKFGSPHLLIDNRRRRLYTVMILLIAPLIVDVIYDAIKSIP